MRRIREPRKALRSSFLRTQEASALSFPEIEVAGPVLSQGRRVKERLFETPNHCRLLSDSERNVATRYAVRTSSGNDHYPKRATFLMNLQGCIAKVYENVDREKNSARVLRDLAALKAAA